MSRILVRLKLHQIRMLEPAVPIVRYELPAAGDLLHIDIKKLARIHKPGHRITGNPQDETRGAGWEFLYVAIDDHSRIAFTALLPDEKATSSSSFLRQAVAYFAHLGIPVRRVMSDNGPCFCSTRFAQACGHLPIRHTRTRIYTPPTNGKAERFIQTAIREWAYARLYQNSAERLRYLAPWIHQYNLEVGAETVERLRREMGRATGAAAPSKQSLTDPDARFLRERGGRFGLGYSGELAVSEDHFIVAVRVTQNATDNASLLPMVAEVERQCRARPQQVLADSGFYSGDNLDALEAQGIDGYIPDLNLARELNRGKRGKENRPPRHRATRRMRRKLRSREGRQTYLPRKALVEPVIGVLKEQRGMRQFLRVGLAGVSTELLLAAISYNLTHCHRRLH